MDGASLAHQATYQVSVHATLDPAGGPAGSDGAASLHGAHQAADIVVPFTAVGLADGPAGGDG